MNYFQSTRLSIGLFLILIYVCNGSVKEDATVPVIIQSKVSTPQDVPLKSNLDRKYSNSRIETSTTLAPPESMSGESCHDDLACLSMASHDRLGLEAIRTLHRQLDDDANGVIELSESDEFLREELKYDDGAEKRQKAFHKNDDMHVSVKELWDVWIKSEVHNWTVEQTADWLATSVELPQYVPIFIMNRVTGAQLPRLAVSNMHFLNNVLGIKDPIHKQKITLKAMDVVLFGPPKDSTSHVKDYILGTLILIALTICWARQEQENAASEKIKLERRLQEHQALQGDASDLKSSSAFSDLEVCQLKQEIELLRNELQRAEGELEDRCWAPPPGLQHWLQLTHEIENKAYVKKKLMAEKQLQQAREACEKLRKKRSSLVGAFVSTHGKSIDDVDRMTQELAERVHRWKQIELMLGFNIINNSGLAYLENMLYRNTPNGRSLLKSRMSSQDDLDDDTNSNYSLPMPPSVTDRGGCEASIPWRGDSHDSSSSERMDEDSDQLSLLPSHLSHLPPHFSRVHFTLGGENESPGDNSRRYVPQATRQNFVGAESEVPPGDSSRRYVPQATRQNFVGVESEAPPGDSSRRYVPQATRQGTNNVNETGQMRSGYRLAKSFSEEFSETIDQEIEKQLVKIQSSQSDNYMQESQHPPPQKPSQKHANRKPKRPLSAPKLGELRQNSSLSNSSALSGSQANSPEEDTSHSTDSGSIPGDPEVEDLKKNTRRHRIHFPKFSKKSIRLSSSNPKIQPSSTG
ncbi:hypothetical protein M8J76_003861 [Diaphorina citri]|nr:hypothetical protein M8J76_003861 [Diaphorina citri]